MKFYRFDCPRQIGKSSWALKMLRMKPEETIVVTVTENHKRQLIKTASETGVLSIDKKGNLELTWGKFQNRIITFELLKHNIEHSIIKEQTRVIILDEVEMRYKKKEIEKTIWEKGAGMKNKDFFNNLIVISLYSKKGEKAVRDIMGV